MSRTMNKRHFIALGLGPWLGAVRAQAAARGSLAELAHYEGADRVQRLVDGAKKEGKLSIPRRRAKTWARWWPASRRSTA